MPKSLPYLASPGSIPKALEKIKSVPTPPRVTQDFVKTKLQIKGGPGNAMAAYLKKIGFVNPDGTPSDLYVKFRNPATTKTAAAQAFRIGYALLYQHHEYAHGLPENDIKGLIIQITGCAEDAKTLVYTMSCIRNLMEFADFEASLEDEQSEEPEQEKTEQPAPEQPRFPPPTHSQQKPPLENRRLGMNLSYTINLNLPPSTDIAVFNAIFKSLKENLLRDIDE